MKPVAKLKSLVAHSSERTILKFIIWTTSLTFLSIIGVFLYGYETAKPLSYFNEVELLDIAGTVFGTISFAILGVHFLVLVVAIFLLNNPDPGKVEKDID